MAQTIAILPDSSTFLTVGVHDGENRNPHVHYSILTIEDGVVIDVDWGYHSVDEARGFSLHHPFPTICPNCTDGCLTSEYCDGCSIYICKNCWLEHNEDAPCHEAGESTTGAEIAHEISKAEVDALAQFLAWMDGFEESNLYQSYKEYESFTDTEWDVVVGLLRHVVDRIPTG